MNGSIREFYEVLTDLSAQGVACSWEDPVTGEVCGEAASHFDGGLVDTDAWVMRYEYRCLKHAQHDRVYHDEVCPLVDASIEWEWAIEDVKKVGASEEVVAILENHKGVVDFLCGAYTEYMRRLLELKGPGTVEEVDKLYIEIVEKARRNGPPRRQPGTE